MAPCILNLNAHASIYGDTKDMAVLQKKYDQFGSKPGYIELQKKTPVIATWDDHDYGVNDGGKEYPMKEESKNRELQRALVKSPGFIVLLV